MLVITNLKLSAAEADFSRDLEDGSMKYPHIYLLELGTSGE